MTDRTIPRELHHSWFPARAAGNAEPLVLLNSLATTTEIWAPLLPDLTAETDVLCLDYAGHGRSPARRCPADLDELARQITEVMDARGVTHAHIAGVSIGGMSALRLAATAGNRIRSVAVIGSTPVTDRDLWHSRKEVVRQWGTRGLLTDVLRRWFTDDYARAQPEVVDAYARMLTDTVDSAYSAFCDVLAGVDMRDELAKITCPTVVISGAADAAATVAQGREIADRIDDARQEVLPGAAHMLQAMAPHRVAALVRENIRRAT
ncbi:3-oxoadipate enol-lactonase [Amycolatopsis mediterranei S699]|uniref:3-oxoadipate enol-lactonase n=2 Tax=Amycolatopsis mediterranei TaxID=33910 RepID=A0A0H3DFJ1_AMYMU|nr:alpha/beta fold hydrolase [Amycolatopsis mediterranei]ADJ48977.1 3-oxoadipate enol-lactonase [Amycolatopsis mediterranei U32]AEK45927.1 3-oxoadipate enol-lactonase [Amycolatopsis mediterranei S699]AFO80685.1 3-oxoadipate enol-lactonase [Amycolatopsis mediterranei S699]AGT87813.1 3-oxoadipate enol-lactonase [Amycolatopsis mediterranei RB]KDU93905.1 3-oxoadipate enol-lactonase [Amycolatopsis mediterranei]